MRIAGRTLPRLPLDPYLVMLLATVALAFASPARGAARVAADGGVYGAVCMLFFLYGARLSPSAVWAGVAHWRLQSLVFGATFVMFPAIGLAAGTLARPFLPGDVVTGVIFLCLLPSTVQSSIAFTSMARGNVPAALCSASISNLLGVLVTPILASVIFPTKGGISAASIGDIALQIVLPFALGQVARRWIGPWLLRHPVVTMVVDRGSILLIVYAAFSAGMVAGVWKQLSLNDLAAVAALDLGVLGTVIVITTLVSRRLGFSPEDEIAIVFCGSKKSMASGVPMANILFAGHAVGLIVLPLMIFHQAQLFICATLARRYAGRSQVPDGSRGAPGVLARSLP